jgi:hypothetical protein
MIVVPHGRSLAYLLFAMVIIHFCIVFSTVAVCLTANGSVSACASSAIALLLSDISGPAHDDASLFTTVRSLNSGCRYTKARQVIPL